MLKTVNSSYLDTTKGSWTSLSFL